MWWILVWLLLLIAAVAVIGLLGWRLFRQVLALGRDLGAAASSMAAAMAADTSAAAQVPSAAQPRSGVLRA